MAAPGAGDEPWGTAVRMRRDACTAGANCRPSSGQARGSCVGACSACAKRRGTRLASSCRMTPKQLLASVRGVHSAIYVAMAASTILVLYAGVTGHEGRWLWVALSLLAI